MRERGKVVQNLAGNLLLAHPGMRDPNFRRTVILLSTHGDDGAMGVVLNRPLGRKLGELSPDFATNEMAAVPVYGGGPVQTEQLILAAWRIVPAEGAFQLHFGIDPEKARELRNEGLHLQAFLGYSGWSKGQLENELSLNTWVVLPVSGDEIAQGQGGPTLWRGLLAGISPELRIMAEEPEDPGVN